MYNIAVILAGGIGSRVGGATPKQLLPLADGRSVLEHAIDAFQQSSSIDEIAVVMHPDFVNDMQQLCAGNHWPKLRQVIPGGAERWQSSWNAVQAYKDRDDAALLLHDAARPFVSQRIIADTCRALEQHEAVTVAVGVTDTLYRIADGRVAEIPPRAEYMRAQTPQAFHLETIHRAYEMAIAHGPVEATDDAGIVRRYLPETPIFIVPGEEANLKITYPEDLK